MSEYREPPTADALTEPDQTWTYEEIAARAAAVRSLYATKHIRLHRDSALGKVLRQAEALSMDWTEGRDIAGIRRLIDASHANRIANAIDLVSDDPQAIEALRRISGNDVNLSARDPSQGKDALWELELLAFLRRRGVDAQLVDPPDIVLDVGFGDYGIACKKVYSERGVEAQLRNGCRQLAPFFGAGVVALNVDDLVPEDVVLTSRTNVDSADFLAQLNVDFIERHRPKLQRFLVEAKCDGVLVSTTIVSDILGSRVRLNNYTQVTLWTLDNLSAEVAERLDALRAAVQATRDGGPG